MSALWLLFVWSFLISLTKQTTSPDYGLLPKFVCSPIPVDSDPGCSGSRHASPSGAGSWGGLTDDAKTTILHLRETIVQQKETILDQRETIRELTAKLTLCEGFGGTHEGPSLGAHPLEPEEGFHGRAALHHLNQLGHSSGHHSEGHSGAHHLSEPYMSHGVHVPNKNTMGDPPKHKESVDQMGRMLQSLKERLENLQHTKNTSTTYSNSLRDLLQRKISTLEHQIQQRLHSERDDGEGGEHGHEDEDEEGDEHEEDEEGEEGREHHSEHHHDNNTADHHDSQDAHNNHDTHAPRYAPHRSTSKGHEDHTPHDYHRTSANIHGSHHHNLDTVMNHLHHRSAEKAALTHKKTKGPDDFQIGFPMRTNYMYGRVKRTLLHELFAMTLCLWLKSSSSPGVGTPFSYSVPGQANELVLIEWGNNPMELLVNDKAVTLPLSINDAKWHHICVTWSTRDGLWESYQDGTKRGTGENLAAWHPIKPGGIFILGQEQDTLGGRFDATQAFVGEMSDLNMWSHVLTPSEIYSLATCGSHATGDIIAWTESVIELHGGVTKYPFDPCH
ncbi:neuronal pentraxin-1 [Polypterus senegalus]|uniref:neuronal pentraxin-1 n=1 Tax=Polypterus senegalus TaxID=55291 RepID=UPI0019640953|nr:neuronal pentraxin-1 [Polypterus senegalus]